jgi:cytochrome bd-type quinol oxidase subunit 1
MVGLGTIFVAVMLVCAFLLWRRKLFDCTWALWALLLCVPFPYIANVAGWVTAEAGRQPWIVYGLMRTKEGVSRMVSTGDTWFTLLGFMGLYGLLSIVFLFLSRCHRSPPNDFKRSSGIIFTYRWRAGGNWQLDGLFTYRSPRIRCPHSSRST